MMFSRSTEDDLLFSLVQRYPEFSSLIGAARRNVLLAHDNYRAGQALYDAMGNYFGPVVLEVAKKTGCNLFHNNDNIVPFLDNLLEILTDPKR